jgi:hypothetical protein
MTIHFAAARNARDSIAAQSLGLQVSAQAANDNGDAGEQAQLLRATLEFFAEHGLGTAQAARARAEAAWLADDANDYRHWFAICRMFDRRMATAIDRRLAPAGK